MNANGLAAAQAAGKGQGAAQVGPPPPKPPDKYQQQVAEMQRNAAFGIFIPDLLKAKSGGREDMQREIKLLIRKQYFTYPQMRRLVVTFTVMGMMIAAALFSALWLPLRLGEFYQSFGFGVCVGAFAMLVYWYFVGENWETICNKHSKYVDPDKRGTECIEHGDCSNTNYARGMCIHRQPPVFSRYVRNSFIPLTFIGAGLFAGMASSAGVWDSRHIFCGAVFGGASAAFAWQLPPLESRS